MRARQRGQTTVEWLTVSAVVVALAAALVHAVPGVASTVVDEMRSIICSVSGGACGASQRGAHAGARPGARAPLSARAATANDRRPPSDRDGDGISDRDERRRGSNPDRADTDGDGMSDGAERAAGTDPRFADTDADGLSDYEEVYSGHKRNPITGKRLDPRNPDSDGDGLNDAVEIAADTDPTCGDCDGDFGDIGDGLSDRQEIDLGTDPNRYDTDGDGDFDGHEVRNGKDPLKDERSLPQKIAESILDNPFDYIGPPAGLIRSVTRKAAERIVQRVVRHLPALRDAKRIRDAIRIRRARRAAVRQQVQSGATAVAQGRSFTSFSAFKRAMGPAGKDKQWHHVVEQRAANTNRFGARAIQNTENLVAVDNAVHKRISAYYSSKQPFTNGLTVRKWLESQSYDQQMRFGRRMLDLAERGQL